MSKKKKRNFFVQPSKTKCFAHGKKTMDKPRSGGFSFDAVVVFNPMGGTKRVAWMVSRVSP